MQIFQDIKYRFN